MSDESSSVQEVFVILLAATTSTDLHSVIATVETAGGRILLSFPPRVIIARLEQLSSLRPHPLVQFVTATRIDEASLTDVDETVRQAVAVWNARFEPPESKNLGRGLSWDAPGHLPDPPPDVRDLLARRERDYWEQTKNDDE